jgi:hypothetical protein
MSATPYLALGIATLGGLIVLWAIGRWLRRSRPRLPDEWRQSGPSDDAVVDAPSADAVYHDAVSRFLDVQVSTADQLDGKTANILQVGSTVLPLALGLLALSGRTPPPGTVIFLGLALGAYGLLLIWSWRASRIRGLEYRPDMATLQRNSQALGGATLRRWVAEEYAASTAANGVALSRKARFVGLANSALHAEGLLIALAAVFVLL